MTRNFYEKLLKKCEKSLICFSPESFRSGRRDILKYVESNKTVGIFGLGSGFLAIDILSQKNPKCLILVDIIKQFLDFFKKQLNEGEFLMPFEKNRKIEFREVHLKGERANVIFLNESIYKTSLPEDFLDIAIGVAILQELKKPLEAIKELKRITKNNGKIILVVPNLQDFIDWKEWWESFDNVELNINKRELIFKCNIDGDIYRAVDKLYSLNEFERLISRIGKIEKLDFIETPAFLSGEEYTKDKHPVFILGVAKVRK